MVGKASGNRHNQDRHDQALAESLTPAQQNLDSLDQACRRRFVTTRQPREDSLIKQDQQPEHWEQLFAPSSCLAMITMIDPQSRGECGIVRHMHPRVPRPVYLAFTVGAHKHTAANICRSGEFVVNLPRFERNMLERVHVVGLNSRPACRSSKRPA
jgi:hypothetical protein